MDLLITQIVASGTIIETATGTKEFILSIDVPFISFVWIAVVFFAAFAVFKLFMIKIWKD